MSYTSTDAIFTLTNLHGVATSDVQVYTSEGFPEGGQIAHAIEVTPSVLSITPSTGSSAGSKILVTGTGFGTETTGLDLLADGSSLCAEVEITGFGEFTCTTNEMDVAVGAVITVSMDSVEQALAYVAADAIYSQSETISVSSATLNVYTIEFSGSNFPTSDHTAYASFAAVEATIVSCVSSSVCIAMWSEHGIGAVTDGTPSLWFEHTDGYSHYAAVDSSVTLSKTLEVTDTTDGLTCSFAGGCTYAIASEGLFAALIDSANSVQMCGSPCVLREDLSDMSYAVCEVPSLSTTYSTDNYQIALSETLHGTVFPEDTILYDELTQVSYITDEEDCSFGLTLKPDHVGVLDEAKIFINYMTEKANYVGNLAFQASNDDFATFDELYRFGEEIHEGWNYINYREADDEKPAYNAYRFMGNATGACKVTEFRLHGVEAIASELATHECTPVIYIGDEALSTNVALAPVTYDSTATALLTRISPRFGSVLGGTTVTLTGENFSASAATTVFFDNRECIVSSQSSTEIVCVTSDKPYVPGDPTTVIEIDGMGLVATQGLVYRYVSLWSDAQTWGYDVPPQEGESIHVPSGQHLLVDVDSVPVLNAIVVEGSIIFAPDENDPDHERTFDCNFILVFRGYMEVGTEEFPYTSKITMTMHGGRESAKFSIYGSKMIGCRYCQLHMHGNPRTVIWTRIAETAEAGDTKITLQVAPDWNIGETFVIAGTNFNNVEDESRVITHIDGATIYFDEPFEFMHFGEGPEFGGVEMPMFAEVGLQTRNVLFRGSPDDSRDDLFGAHIMVHSPGDETSMARIMYIEFTEAG